MLDCESFCSALEKRHIGLVTGVPDSLLSGFSAYVMDSIHKERHIITANEGGAIALATGHYLATQQISLVYMQNSGLGNAINPLVSLADASVYSIPMLLMIGWRGEPNQADEPQHLTQGRITLGLLDTLGIPYAVLPDNTEELNACLDVAFMSMQTRSAPYALVVRKGTFSVSSCQKKVSASYTLTREQSIQLVIDHLSSKDVIVSTTGMASRELFEYRKALEQGHSADFLTVGSMGHASHIALGIALAKPERNVYCLDGDGALIMHMGCLPIIASQSVKNLKHIVLNNGAHDSVGGQPTTGFMIDIPAIAKSCGYKTVYRADTSEQLVEAMQQLRNSEGTALLEIRIKTGVRKDLGRPTRSPIENKTDFMAFLST